MRPATRLSNRQPVLRFLIGAAAAVIFVAGIKAASPIAVPFLMALFVAVIATPVFLALQRHGVPSWLALLILVLGLVLIVLGLFSMAGFEFNLTTIAGFLTLIGYSVNDTVVVFDRVRENLRRSRREPLVETMNKSLNQTLSRTVLTSSTTLLAVGSLLLFGGDVLRGFAFIITVGVIVGTYSSIYVASPFALLWEKWFGAGSKRRTAGRAAA